MRILSLSFTLAIACSMACAQSLSGPTASSVLSGMNSAFSGRGQIVSSVELSGTAHIYEGAATDSGPATLTVNMTGGDSLQLQLSRGTRTEKQTSASDDRNCTWSRSDGVSHAGFSGNCWIAVFPFLPQMSLQTGGLSGNLGTQFLGLEKSKRGTFYVIQNQPIVAPGKTPAAMTALIQKQSTTGLYIDPATLLPSALDYTMHSDSGAVALSVEMRYSNYQRLSGLMIPTRIERYLNGSLELAIDVTQATILK